MSTEIKKGNLSLNSLKYIAIAAMLIDHIAIAFVDQDSNLFLAMDLIGRITGPIMFYAAVEGYHHTSNLTKYLKRLFIFAMISYLPAIYAFQTDFDPLNLNVIFTIFFGVLAITARRKITNPLLKTVIIFSLIIISVFGDYGVVGVLIILVFDFYYGNLKNQLFAYLVIVFSEFGVLYFFTNPIYNLAYGNAIDFQELRADIVNLGYFLPAILLSFYSGKQGQRSNFSKWAFYVFYPAHLIIIGIIRFVIEEM